MECIQNEKREGLIRQEHQYPVGDGMTTHRHKDWQFIAVLTGRLKMLDGQVLASGESILIPAGQDHSYTALEPTTTWSMWGPNL
jgi:quercetin dioxygenase-like cupin family protein